MNRQRRQVVRYRKDSQARNLNFRVLVLTGVNGVIYRTAALLDSPEVMMAWRASSSIVRGDLSQAVGLDFFTRLRESAHLHQQVSANAGKKVVAG